MSDRWCFQCRSQYVEEVAECLECGVPLVDEVPIAPEKVGDGGEDQIAYELHDWSFAARHQVDTTLSDRRLRHAWQGAALVVREADEDRVDKVIEEIEQQLLPTLDADMEHIEYSMEGWKPEQSEQLSSRLGLRGVPHEFDRDGNLIAHAEDEEEVDATIEDVTARLADGEEVEKVDLPGLETNKLLTRLFVASDRLRKNPRDSVAILDFTTDVATMERIRTPFGLDSGAWKPIVANAQTIRDEFESETDLFDDEVVVEMAGKLRTALHGLI